MRFIDVFLYSNKVSIASRVVPGIGETIDRDSCVMVLTNVDFPTFGRPIIESDIDE